MHENIRRLRIPARQTTDSKEHSELLAHEETHPDSQNHHPEETDAPLASSYVQVELTESDFAALKRILASLADDDARPAGARDGHAGRRVARIMFSMRQARTRLFPAAMFNEPAWDMLMALYVAHEVSAAADLARWTQTPLSTAMRWIEYLESHKLIVRESSPADRRAHMIRLTDHGRASMEKLFSEVVEELP